MKKMSFWKSDWFVGLLVALVFLFGANTDLMRSLERKAYDLGVMASLRSPSYKIAVIAIDDQSIADALDFAHKQNVVHRDIKPANIMYDPETDTAKVTDFGIARITDSSKTKTGMVLGTPSFMSPEQLAGKKIEGGSDLFSLGASLYQLACGKLPFEGDSLAQLMYRIANEPHTGILSAKADLPPCLAAIIDRSLAKRIEDRHSGGAEMAEALRRCAAALQG